MAIVKKKGVRPLRKVVKAKARPKAKPMQKTIAKAKQPIAKVKKKRVVKKVQKTVPTKTATKTAVKPAKTKKVIKTATPVHAKKPIVSKKAETKIGVVTHYYAHIGVAVIQLDQKPLRVEDRIHVKGHTTDFTQSVESMEVDHQPVTQVKAGEIFGMKVTQHVRVGDTVYKG